MNTLHEQPNHSKRILEIGGALVAAAVVVTGGIANAQPESNHKGVNEVHMLSESVADIGISNKIDTAHSKSFVNNLPDHKFYVGACPTNPGGASSAAAKKVVDMLGVGAGVRLFYGTDLGVGPATTPGASFIDASWNLNPTKVNQGKYDKQWTAMLTRASAHVAVKQGEDQPKIRVGINHEPDLIINHQAKREHLTAKQTDKLRESFAKANNRMFQRTESFNKTHRDIWYGPTFTGGLFSNHTPESLLAKYYIFDGNSLSIDFDGVSAHSHKVHTYAPITYTDEIEITEKFLHHVKNHKVVPTSGGKKSRSHLKYWGVSEMNIAREAWDKKGEQRRAWMVREEEQVIRKGGRWLLGFDYDIAPANTSTRFSHYGPRELQFQKQLVAIARQHNKHQ